MKGQTVAQRLGYADLKPGETCVILPRDLGLMPVRKLRSHVQAHASYRGYRMSVRQGSDVVYVKRLPE